VSDGIHVASCGGVWMALVNGFAGLRDVAGDDLRFTPRLPADWDRMRFRLIFRGSRLEVEMTQNATSYTLLDGAPLAIISDGQRFDVAPGEPVVVPVVIAAAAGEAA
jgi:alpha,alpha-trehalose phosphorylase